MGHRRHLARHPRSHRLGERPAAKRSAPHAPEPRLRRPQRHQHPDRAGAGPPRAFRRRLPHLAAGKAIGVLTLYAEQSGFFDVEEMKLLSELAGDISLAADHLEKAEKLNYLAYYDPVTDLGNRQLFLERLEERLRAAKS